MSAQIDGQVMARTGTKAVFEETLKAVMKETTGIEVEEYSQGCCKISEATCWDWSPLFFLAILLLWLFIGDAPYMAWMVTF